MNKFLEERQPFTMFSAVSQDIVLYTIHIVLHMNWFHTYATFKSFSDVNQKKQTVYGQFADLEMSVLLEHLTFSFFVCSSHKWPLVQIYLFLVRSCNITLRYLSIFLGLFCQPLKHDKQFRCMAVHVQLSHRGFFLVTSHKCRESLI